MDTKLKVSHPFQGEKLKVAVWGIILCFGWGTGSAAAEEEEIPWECSEYTGDFQRRCINAVKEMEDDKFEVFHRQRIPPDERITKLQKEVDRQADVIAGLESQLRDRGAGRYRDFSGNFPYRPKGIWYGIPWRYPGFYGFGPGFGGFKGPSPKFRGGKSSRNR